MIQYLLFDLDNTLYSEASGLETGVLRRINQFVADMFDMPYEEAVHFRREHTKPYGTTLEWLMVEQGFNEPERYFRYIHPEGEEDCLEPDLVLRAVLESMPQPKAIMTNAPAEHARRILLRLGVADCFIGVYDIWFNDLRGKPHPDAYRRTLEACGFDIARTLFIDDHPKYIKGYVDLGGIAVLKDEMDRFESLPWPRIRTVYELPEMMEELEGQAF